MQVVDTLNLNGNKITGLGAPTLDTDAATRLYVSQQVAAAGGMDAEGVQDVVGLMMTDSTTVNFAYDDLANTETAHVLDSPTVAGATPAQLRDRATHTGSQASGTITQSTGTILGRTTALAGPTEELTPAAAKTLLAIGSADVSDFATAADARVNAVVTGAFVSTLTGVDADTLGGGTRAQVVAEAIAGVVDTAPATLDTLNELALALGNDANFATTVNNALAARVRSVGTTIGDGVATTYTVTHNLGTRDVTVAVYDISGTAPTYEEVWTTTRRPTINTVELAFGAAPATGQYRVVVQGRPD